MLSSSLSKQTTIMSPSLSHTVDQDVDDDELCMVCDGKCTCASSSSQPLASTSAAPFPTVQPKLKIKLPPKPKIPSGLPPDLPDHLVPPQQQPPPKRRGRPPKNGISAASRSRLKPSASSRRPLPKKQTKDGTKKRRTPVKRKRVDSTDDESSDLTDIDQLYTQHHHHSTPGYTGDDDGDEDDRSTQFPTFASSISSASSTDSDSASLSGFETDSSIEAEEESFIIAQERARVRRELMGEETLQKRRDNNWVIRPRKRSVGNPSDVDMAGDSDASEEDDDAQDDEQDDDDDDEQDESDRPGAGYVGFATGWSDDESSFDADLFFANLSSDPDGNGSSTQGDDEVDAHSYQSDLDVLAASIVPQLRQGIHNMPFEVSEGWDGQIVFTNGLGEAQGTVNLDVPFPPSPIIFPEQSVSPPRVDGGGDVDMISTTDADPDEDGYEQDVDTVGEDDGDTTDEELVGEDDLPNEHAMQLFNMPFTSVSYINPLSTMSPVSSPGPRRGSAPFGLDSPKPADILAGRAYCDSDEPEDFENDSRGLALFRGGGPRQGEFEITKHTRRAVIDGQHTNIPSPHPRFKGRHNRLSASRSIGLDSLLRRTLQPIRPSSLPPSIRFPLTLSPSSEVVSMSPELLPTQVVDIDDVLDSSFLDADPPIDSELQECGDGETSSTESAFEVEDSHKHIQNLKRWDVISVGAFRKTREAAGGGCLSDSATAGWGSDSPADYSAAMKSSPMSDMLWQNRNGQQSHAQHSQASSSSSRLSYALSPDLLPVTDGDRTPTSHPRTPVKGSREGDNHQHQKTRKDIRKERRLKQKSFTTSRHSQHRNHHHFHQHHPNLKSRSTSSNQRNFSSPSSMPALNI
ncbi:hypothetical protein E1B28_007459 [Marasmius oreades]|uniref:Uncharacterized protein n=1 Tax=Marasmius oreades TaxID=181124 RepID=A0A9P7S286_9AGAR|nr:uncharacterized protein E1B28_007459 [Marasmius oreades]KAG7093818.1 hypothetical protein E1B28_007459 [Marasmius oreades]